MTVYLNFHYFWTRSTSKKQQTESTCNEFSIETRYALVRAVFGHFFSVSLALIMVYKWRNRVIHY